MTFAVVWTFVRSLPWGKIVVGVAVLAMALLIWRAPWAESRQKAKDDIALSAEQARADGFRANQDTLTAALNHQNATVAALTAESDKRLADGKSGLASSQKTEQPQLDKAANLKRNAALKPMPGDPCVVSETLIKAGAI